MADSSLHMLIVPSWYFASGSDSLTGRMFSHHAAALRELGHDARVWFPDFSPLQPPGTRIRETVEEGVPTTRVSAWVPPMWSYSLAHRRVVKVSRQLEKQMERQGRPDLMHAQSYLAACGCAPVCRKLGIPLVYTERNSRWISRDVPMSLMPDIHAALRDAGVVTCVSPGLRDRLSVQTNRPIEVVPPHVDERIFYRDPEVEKSSRFTWVSVGEPSGTKGLAVLIDAFAGLAGRHPGLDTELVLVDRIPEEPMLRQQAVQRGVADRVRFAGQLSQTDLADLYRRSHVCISASRIETFGKAMAEAQSCGLPILATPTDGARYILSEEGQGILLSGFGSDDLTTAMADMAEAYDRYRPAEIAAGAARFSRLVVMTRWMEIYQSLLP